MNSIPDDANAPNTPGWLKGHPIIDPKPIDATVHFQKPDDAGTVGVPDVREQVVVSAIDALFAFAGHIGRPLATTLLHHWTGFGAMTPAEVDAVLDSYPRRSPGRKKAAPTTNRRGI